MSGKPAPRRTDRAARVVRAALEAVYRAMLDPAALAEWLPPAGMTGTVHALEPRPGGVFRMTLTYDAPDPDAPGKSSDDTDVVESRFVELVPDERIVQRVEFVSDDPAFAGAMTMTWALAAVAGGTEVTITAAEVPPGIRQEDHDEGLRSTLENLAAYLER